MENEREEFIGNSLPPVMVDITRRTTGSVKRSINPMIECHQPTGSNSSNDPKTESENIETIISVGAWIVDRYPEHFQPEWNWGWERPPGGVTNIRTWQNETDEEVEVWKLDGGSKRRDHDT